MRISLSEALMRVEEKRRKKDSPLAEENPFWAELKKLQTLQRIERETTLRRLQNPSTQTDAENLAGTTYQTIIKPDGSRVLVITMQVDGETFVRAIKLTDPDAAAGLDAANILLPDGGSGAPQ